MAMSDACTIGWDLGGAHLKFAVAAPDQRVLAVTQLPCPLWQGLDKLTAALQSARTQLPQEISEHAVTMTGELVDLFASRREGVIALIECFTAAFPNQPVRFFAGTAGLVAPAEAGEAIEQVASANWLASAQFLASRMESALFVDLGSTTADILPIARGAPQVQGVSDHARMVAGELVYTGVTRTPVMAMAQRVAFEGAATPLMAEYFATAADLHHLTGRLPEDVDQHPSADGGPKTLEGAARRLARMLGRDLESAPMAAWQALAGQLGEMQLRSLQDAALQVLSRSPLPAEAPLVGAGIGRFLLRDLAVRLDRPYRDFADLVTAEAEIADWAACCAPAVALALLASDQPA